jgi:uncharacterized repeat protein (TIGR04042 family)
MPEMRFQVRWPDGSEEECYSPSLVIKDYFEPGATYSLNEFLEKSRVALETASDRVKAKFGFPCRRALGQLQRIEFAALQYQSLDEPKVQVLQFIE